MEIIDYLNLARRRIGLLLGLPLVAALLVIGITYLQPAQYKSTATVSTSTLVGGPDNSFNGPQGPNQFTAAYAAAVEMPEVSQKVSEQTGVPAADIRADTSVAPAGASSQMVVTYYAAEEKNAEPVVQGVAMESLREIFEPRAKAAENARTIAQQQVDEASKQLAQFVKDKGVADPLADYQAQLSKINGLQQQQANYRANGNSTAAASLEKPISDAQARLVKLSEISVSYNSLEARRKAASDDLASAQQAYRRAAAEWGAAQGTDVVFVTKVAPVDRLSTLMTLLPAAVAAALLLAVVLVLVMEMFGRRRSVDGEADEREARASARE